MKDFVKHYLDNLQHHWKSAFQRSYFRILLISVIGYLVALIISLNPFFLFIQERKGSVLPDALLSLLSPHDFSRLIFPILYGSILLALVYLLPFPEKVLRVLLTIALAYSLRCLTLYFTPLNPPAGIIPLSDPFVQGLAYGNTMITKDLFFSGHTTTLLLLLLACSHRLLKYIFGLALMLVVLLLLWQHVHYTIDIIGSLIATPLCWRFAGYIASRR